MLCQKASKDQEFILVSANNPILTLAIQFPWLDNKKSGPLILTAETSSTTNVGKTTTI